MRDDRPVPKWFSGSLAAYGRLGIHELRNALYPESNVAQGHSEYGMWAAPTPGQVQQAQEKDGIAPDSQKGNEVPPQSILDERMRDAERSAEHRERDDRSREDREHEIERE